MRDPKENLLDCLNELEKALAMSDEERRARYGTEGCSLILLRARFVLEHDLDRRERF